MLGGKLLGQRADGGVRVSGVEAAVGAGAPAEGLGDRTVDGWSGGDVEQVDGSVVEGRHHDGAGRSFTQVSNG